MLYEVITEIVDDLPPGEGSPLERFLAEAALLNGQDKTAGEENGITPGAVATRISRLKSQLAADFTEADHG